MPYSNLSLTLAADKKAAIFQCISQLKENLPFLINLSKEERKNMRTVGAKRSAYVSDVRKVTKANATAIPAIIDVAEYEKDAQLYLDLSEIFTQLQPIFEGLDDTILAAGNEAIRTSDQCYAHLKTAARGNANLKLVLADLAKHFEGQGKKKPTPANK